MALVSRSIRRFAKTDGRITTVITTPPPDVEWFAVPSYLNNQHNVAFSETVRAYATGTGASSAVLTLTSVSGDTPATLGLWVSGDSLKTDAATVGEGSVKLRGTYSGNSFDSNAFTFSVVTGAAGFPLWEVYNDIVTARGGTSIPESNTRYWDKPTYPTSGTTYTTVAALQTAINSASPGDTLFLQDGTYTDGVTLTCGSSGSSGSPIQICAETKGGVTFTGDLDVDITGDFVDFMGFNWSGTNDSSEVISSDGDDILVAYITFSSLACDNGLNNQFYFDNTGARNRVCYSTVTLKESNRAAAISRFNATYERWDHCFFDRVWGGGGSGDDEVIQIDQAGAARDHYALVDNNYIYRWNNNGGFQVSTGEGECVTNKSSSNMFIRNYLYECTGNMNDRESHRSTYYANIIDGNGVNLTGGIQLGGDDSYAFCNYIVNINPSNGGRRGIAMRQGGTGTYEPSVDNEASFNYVGNSERSYAMGAGGSGLTDPSGCLWYNNACHLRLQDGPSFDPDNYVSATFGGNIIESPSGFDSVPSGVTVATPDASLDNGYYVPTDSGNLDGTGVTGWNALCTVDLLGTTIPASGSNVGPFQGTWDLTTNPAQEIIDNAGA